MQFKLKSTMAVLLIAAATSFTGSAPASAANFGFELKIGSHHSSPQIRFYNTHKKHRKYSRNRCNPHGALKKARHRFGVHHGKVTRMNKRKVVVRGFNHGHRVKVIFANRRGCPVLARR